ncbi:MAG: transposase, partial [Thermotogae bacterium]|nr:transposase [Thermotogota bacterium]
MYRYRVALGSLLIQTILKTTDQETVAQIRENPYLQYFLGLKAYTMKPIIDSSSLARFRKRLSLEDWQALNEALVNTFKKKESEKETGTKALSLETTREETEEPPSSDQRRGQLILDATCIPSDITYPTDLDLLNQAREKAEALLDEQYASD